MKGIHIFPIRHHSPASSLLLEERIRQLRPELILIEGPSDANPLIDILHDPASKPPLSILAYTQPDDETDAPRYLMYPFASYSPEYAALKAARHLETATRFIDIPASVAIQWYTEYEQMTGAREVFDQMVSLSGYRSFDEFWEASFESGRMGFEAFTRSMLDFAGILRRQQARQPGGNFRKELFREEYMRRQVAGCLAEGYAPDKILLVCGAFHAAAFIEHEPEQIPQDLPAPPDMAIQLTIVHYSYPRLSEQYGYGAGNRAPLYYEKIYQHSGDFETASLETMLAFMNRLHVQGYGVSLANVIEANRMAKILAGMRAKQAPGLEEIREALTACLMHGEEELVDRYLKELSIGRAVGTVSSRIGKTALQQEFYREIERSGIPLSDSPQDFMLHLTNKTEITTSIFLHRLRLCGIPFARNLGAEAGAYEFLSQVREKWQVQWTPAVDTVLVEKSLLGNSLHEVCARRLREVLSQAQTAREAAETLLEIVICQLQDMLPDALALCDSLAAEDSDFFSLAKACQNLQALISYGSSREVNPADFTKMLEHAFNRAVLILPAAAAVSDDAVEQVCGGMVLLQDLCARAAGVNSDLFYSALAGLIDSYHTHPKTAGLAASIAHLANILSEEELLRTLSQRLSPGNAPLNGALFLDGFLSLNKIVLVRNMTIVTLLDLFVQSVPSEDFTTSLPALRRAFSELSKNELEYFIENLSVHYNIADTTQVKHTIEGTLVETLQESAEESLNFLDEIF